MHMVIYMIYTNKFIEPYQELFRMVPLFQDKDLL